MFIVIEGPDGSGKTTVTDLLVKALNKKGLKARKTSEPTSSDYGKTLRKMLSDSTSTPKQLYDLFVLDRIEHLKEIAGWEQDGEIVISDRYKYSTYCYQVSHGLDPALTADNNALRTPDVTLILTADVDVLLSRIESRALSKEIYETRGFLEKITAMYSRLPEIFGEEFNYIDVDDTLDNVVKKALDIIEGKITA